MKSDVEKILALNIGCGEVFFDGWINIDLDSKKADLNIDVRDGLPYKDGSVDFIYCEHFIEHLDKNEGVKFMIDCRRALKDGGVLRIATLDLSYLVRKYLFGWKNQDWIKRHGYDWLKTKAEMLNLCFYEWGHKYLYNGEELVRRLKEADFKDVKFCRIECSDFSKLQGLETRKDSKLIVEAKK